MVRISGLGLGTYLTFPAENPAVSHEHITAHHPQGRVLAAGEKKLDDFAAADYRCFSANFRQQAGRKWCFYAQSWLSVVDTVTMLTKGLEQS